MKYTTSVFDLNLSHQRLVSFIANRTYHYICKKWLRKIISTDIGHKQIIGKTILGPSCSVGKEFFEMEFA